jgi:hypothetical protein
MTAYTRWGTSWPGYNQNPMSGILRGEWDNKAMYIVGNIITDYCDASAAIVISVLGIGGCIVFRKKDNSNKKLWFTGIHNSNLKSLIKLYGVNEATSEKARQLLKENDFI